MRNKTMSGALSLYKELAGSVTTIIDVGAQGCTDFLIESFPECHHYLFEPVPLFHPMIADHYRNISHTLCTKALYDGSIDKIQMKLWSVHIDNVPIVSGGQVYFGREPDPTLLLVDVSTLDKFFTEENVDLGNFNSILKIDVDGVDYEIMQGGADVVLPNIGLLIIECNHLNLTTLVSAAESMGFEIWDIVSRCYQADQFVQCDVLMINKKLKETNIKFRPREGLECIDFAAWDDTDR